ncbi:MAG: ClpX C4-type zinc finger protein [Hyalangium sp.]|uniref:ClpX C4-type zinc finger protein n=1 Tax=Hyalangium sp. TaxID=2028555 RepID=UPI00389AB35B
MANPRDHIRAAQAAELRGDKAGAIAELRKAAELYRRAGNAVRALQVLRHAQSLDPSLEEVSEELRRLEGLSGSSDVRASHAEVFEASAGGRELKPDPDELAERQRLIEEALRQEELPGPEAESQDAMRRWAVTESPEGGSKPVDLQAASRRALEWALQQAQEEEKPPREWPVEEEGSQAELPMRPVAEAELPVEEPARAVPPVKPRPADVALEVRPLVEGDMTAIVADVEVDSYAPRSAAPSTPSPEGEAMDEKPRAQEPSLFDRGPTRADPAIDAWCSFCCRPSQEVGELVAGPTGSFICAACVIESRGLLSLEDTAPARPRASRRKAEQGEAMGLIGQESARALLDRALQAGARRLMVIGAEGTGKTVWFRELAREDRGTLVTLDMLEQGGGGAVVLVEDVDRLLTEDWSRLGAILARYPERTVLMSARGTLEDPGLVLHGASGSLPVFTTSALSQAMLDAMPLELLEQVQVAIPLQVPTEAEFMEIARRRLALRGSELSLSGEVLAAFASEAARSPRAGHELNALLTRVLAGAWSLAGEEKKPHVKKAGGKGAATKGSAKRPARRGRRKGTV